MGVVVQHIRDVLGDFLDLAHFIHQADDDKGHILVE